jgi:hypothetical protein
MTKEIDPKTVDLLHQNMKCRLFDIVGEYLDDDNYSCLTFINDLNAAVKEWENFHKKKQDKASAVLSFIAGPSDNLTGGITCSDKSIIHFNYTEEELNAMCDKAASDQEKARCQEYNLREAEYYNQRAKMDITTKKDWDEFWEHK